MWGLECAMKNNRGMTLIEVLIAIVITFIVFLGLSGSGLFVLNENIKNSLRDEAVSVAGMEMEQVRNASFDSLYLAPGTLSVDNVERHVRGLTVNYGVTRTVTILDLNNLQVSINVSWTRTENNQTKTYNDNIATIVRR
jgi:prepilin-type N-terminal cleavage/methylation domain-containing protein